MAEIPGSRAPLVIDSPAVRFGYPRLSRWLSRASVAILVAPVPVVFLLLLVQAVFGPVHGPTPDWLSPLLGWGWFLGPPVLALASVVAGAAAVPVRRALHVDEAGVEIWGPDGRTVIPARDVEAGIVVPSEGGSAVELHLRDGRSLHAEVAAEEEAHAVLEALGVGPERRRVEVTLRGEGPRLVAGCLAYPLSIFAAIMALAVASPSGTGTTVWLVLSAIFVTLVPLLARRLAAPVRVYVGADGVRVEGRWGARTLPFTELERVAAQGESLMLHPRGDGPPVQVGCADPALRVALVDRIHDAMATARRGASAAVAAQLDPEGRAIGAWREALGKLLREGGGYRSVSVGVDEVLAVLEDASAPPRRRIGAALALRGGEVPEARARVRIAAEACVDDEVRAALEAAAEEEVDEAPIRRVMDR